MKDLFIYSPIKKFVLWVMLGLSIFLYGTINTYAEEISGFSTQYYYSDITDVTTVTNFRTGDANNVLLYGKENYSPTYDNYEYLTGFDNYIPYTVSSGTTYTVKVFWSATNVRDFNETNFNARLNGLSLVNAVNGVITYQKTTFNKNNCMTYMSDEYCTYNFITTYTFNATTNATAFRVGTYNNNAYSLYGVGNYLSQLVSVNSIDVIVNADNTIINQNEQIIDQNQVIIDNSNKTNEELENLNDNLTSEDGPDTSGLGDVAGWLPSGPVDSLINLPLSLFNSISRDLGSSCSPITLPLPYVNKDLVLPCMSTFYEGIGIGDFMNWIGIIASGFILFSYLMKLYKWVDDTLTFRENNHLDNWGGV